MDKQKERCHTCKENKDRNKFYMKKDLIYLIKCKACCLAEYKQYRKENPLF